MKYAKPHLTYEQQAELLVRRGLVCPDQAVLRHWLTHVGYYRLSAYFIPFKDSHTDRFRTGTTLERVTDLYLFDCELRKIVQEALEPIEIRVRAVITYQVGIELGVFGYANPANFTLGFDHSKFMRLIRREEDRSTELFVKHFRTKYGEEANLPIWMATELMSFGALSKMFGHLKPGLRKRISREFGQPQPVFVSWLHALTAVRNICAHHSRLWNRELSVKPVLPDAWNEASMSNERFYALARIIQSLLGGIAPEFGWSARLRSLFDEHPNVSLDAMRFPPN